MQRTRKNGLAYRRERKDKNKYEAPDTCPFCTPEHQQLLKTTRHMLLLRNKFPYQYWEDKRVADHLLIAPKRHIRSMSEYTADEKIEAMDLCANHEKRGYNVYSRSVENDTKTVAHQHTHLVKLVGKGAQLKFYLKKPYIVWHI